MAIPPEPIEEIILHADLVVLGKVREIKTHGETPSFPKHEPYALSDVGGELPRQTATLDAIECWKGNLPKESLSIEKPSGEYCLVEGIELPFLLQKNEEGYVILGRYGGGSWNRSSIQKAIQSSK